MFNMISTLSIVIFLHMQMCIYILYSYVCVYVKKGTCMYIYIYIYACIHVRMCVYESVCVYI